MSPVQFKSPAGGGDWWAPQQPGMFRMKLVDIEDGPELEFGPTVKWRFEMYNMDGTPVKYVPSGGPNAGKEIQAVADGLTSFSTGPRSTARQYFQALLGRALLPTDDINVLQQEVIGKECIGSWGPNTKGRMAIQSLMPAM
jgi:hypothetical protein